MSFNLVDLIKDQLTDQVVGYVGNMLGGNSDQGSSVLSAAVPAILGGLMNSASEPSGAETIFNSINKTDDSILDNIGDMLGGDNSGSLMSIGADLLGSAFGGNNSSTLGSIVDAVSSFSGSDKGATKSIMGLLAPVIFSVIKKQLMGSGSNGFSIGNLVDMFTGQKDNIKAALPKGLDLNFDNNSYEAPRQVEPQGKSGLGKLLPLALLLGGAWIAYNMFFKGGESVEQVNHATQEINMANLGQNVTGTMNSLVSTLKGVKDVSSAKAAVSTLTEATNNLGTYAGMLDKLPADARGKVTKYVMNYVPELEGLLNNVSSIPGVGPILKPVVEGLSAKLALFK